MAGLPGERTCWPAAGYWWLPAWCRFASGGCHPPSPLLPALPLQTAEPPDPAAATPEQLMRFLQQAGWPAEAVLALPDQEALVAAARSAR